MQPSVLNPFVQAAVDWLDNVLEPSKYSDMAINGVQVEADSQLADSQPFKIAFAVDAGLSIIQEAITAQAQLLVVHHGIFWGNAPLAIRGILAQKIKLLLQNGCTLYAAHLPLDGHLTFGNASQMLQFIEAEQIRPFCMYKQMSIGAVGQLAATKKLTEIRTKLSGIPGFTKDLMLPFGKTECKTIGVVTGSGSFAIEEAATANLDLLISGEPKQEAYHLAKELNINVLFVGHYASETFGVRALQHALAKEFGCNTVFIDEPTGI